jgi:hypothetical protein
MALGTIVVPLEKEINETVALERVIRGIIYGAEEDIESLGVGRRVEEVGLADATRSEEDIEDEGVAHLCPAHRQLADRP